MFIKAGKGRIAPRRFFVSFPVCIPPGFLLSARTLRQMKTLHDC